MNEPMPNPPKEGMSTVAKVLIGCGVVLLVVFLAMGACAVFVGKKVADIGEDFRDNPAKAAAEFVVKVNPELDLVETDDAAQTITVRNNKTGEEATFDWSEIEDGRLSFDSGEGSVTFDAQGDEDGGVITMTGEDGETASFGAGTSAEIPAWVPIPSNAGDRTSAYQQSSSEGSGGAFTFTSSDSYETITSFYQNYFNDNGFTMNNTSYTRNGAVGGMVTGENDSSGQTVSVIMAAVDEGTQVTINYSDSN